MYKLKVIDKILCRHSGFSKPYTFSIWFNDKDPNTFFKNILTRISPCNTRLFPAVYWTVLVLSVMGFLLSVFEFLTISGSNRMMTTFRERYFYVLSFKFRKNCRLLGSVFMAFINILLFLGLIMVSPSSMVPWLWINGAILLFEIFLWICDVIKNNHAFSFTTFLSFIIFTFSWCLTNCVRDIFEKGIHDDRLEDFQMCGKKGCFSF